MTKPQPTVIFSTTHDKISIQSPLLRGDLGVCCDAGKPMLSESEFAGLIDLQDVGDVGLLFVL